jgi:hypothetical protein
MAIFSWRAKHPKVAELETEVAELREKVAQYELQHKNNTSSLRSYQDRIRRLDNEGREFRDRIRKLEREAQDNLTEDYKAYVLGTDKPIHMKRRHDGVDTLCAWCSTDAHCYPTQVFYAETGRKRNTYFCTEEGAVEYEADQREYAKSLKATMQSLGVQ